MRGDLASVYDELREQQKAGGAKNLISHHARVRRVSNFYQESSLHHFTLQSDEHEEPWGGSNKAPSPLGYMLSAIGFSINNQILIQSAVSGLKLDSLETVVTGWFDPKGTLAIRGHNPRLTRISLEFRVESSSSHARVRRVVEKATLCDPIFQTLRRAAKMEKKVIMIGPQGQGRTPIEGGHKEN